MRRTKANIAGLTSLVQQAEMKSILAGTWPPLKPLPVFKYETTEYRATIDFDKKLGEWVCRKTSLPSNAVQELRGGLSEITLALPHDEGEVFTEEAKQQEHELEKDINRRLQAIHDWRVNYESGALYFELRDHLSESQQSETDDSLRLSLTARQLQFNPKNVAYVFDALSTAGGRFATLIEFAQRKRARQGTEPQAQAQGATSTIDHHKQSEGNSSRELEGILDNQIVRHQEAAAHCTDSDELPALTSKNLSTEPEQTSSLAEWMTPDRTSRHLESESSEIVDTDSVSLVENPYTERQRPPVFTGLAAQVQTCEASAEDSESSSSRFSAWKISPVHMAIFAALFLSAVFAFTVGLTLGRRPFWSRLQEAPRPVLATDIKSPTRVESTKEPTSQISAPVAKSANESRNTGESEFFAKARPTSADSSGPTLSAKDEVSLARSLGPGSPVPRRLVRTISATPRLSRSSAILVTLPGRGSHPFWVSFPEKTIAATSSLAMSSQLSVQVSADPGLRVAHQSARLEAGDLVSFVWPGYPRPGNHKGLAETIRVRATIGQLGQVRDVKFLSGSNSLLPATKAAILQWRYRPTLLDKRPVQVQQDVTVEFRPPQYSTQVAAQYPNHN